MGRAEMERKKIRKDWNSVVIEKKNEEEDYFLDSSKLINDYKSCKNGI